MPNRQIVNGEPYRYAYQGQEKDPETGKEAFQLRLWDARIGRWLTTDPYGQYASPYLGMGNNPIRNIDPDGGFSGPGDDDCCGDDVDGGMLDEVVIGGKSVSTGYNLSTEYERYGWGGTLAQYQERYGLEGMNYSEMRSWWEKNHASSFYQWVDQQDQAEKDRINMQRLTFFLNGAIAVSTVLSPSFSSTSSLATARSFNFKGIYSPPQTTTVYRNFGWNELGSLKLNRGFTIQQNGFGAKQFWLNDEGINWWSGTAFSKPFTAKITVKTSALKHGTYFKDVGKYEAISFDSQKALDIFNESMTIKWIKF